jgi:hypothetical protein
MIECWKKVSQGRTPIPAFSRWEKEKWCASRERKKSGENIRPASVNSFSLREKVGMRVRAKRRRSGGRSRETRSPIFDRPAMDILDRDDSLFPQISDSDSSASNPRKNAA